MHCFGSDAAAPLCVAQSMRNDNNTTDKNSVNRSEYQWRSAKTGRQT